MKTILSPLDRRTRRRLWRLGAILCRPRLRPVHAAAVHRLLESPGWHPVPPTPSLTLLLPLWRHHLDQHGLDLADVVSLDNVDLPSSRQLVLVDAKRRRALNALFRHLAGAGLTPMVVKGAALLHRYPSPALRPMCDVDLVLGGDEVAAAASLLQRAGWIRADHGGAIILRDPETGLLADLHPASTNDARGILARAVPLPRQPGVLQPDAPDHLRLVALHAVRDGGFRFWRDLCDARALVTGASDRPALFRESLDRAPGPARSAVAAFLLLLDGADGRVPVHPPGPEARRIARHLRDAATSPYSPAEFALLKNLLARPPRSSSAATGAPFVERDPALGDMPPPGHWRRQALRARTFLRVLLRGDLPAMARAARANQALQPHTAPFRPPPTP